MSQYKTHVLLRPCWITENINVLYSWGIYRFNENVYVLLAIDFARE